MRVRLVRALATLLLAVGLLGPAPGAGGAATTRLAARPDGGSVTRVLMGPGDDVVAFLARDGSGGIEELYAVGLYQGAEPKVLSRVDGGVQVQVDLFGFSHDGTQLFFAGSRMASGPVDHALYRVPADGSAAATRLSPQNDSITEVVRWVESPDGNTLAYVLRDENNVMRGIWAVPTDGSEVDAVEVSTGGYLPGVSNTDAIVASGTSLYRVPLTGPPESRVALTPQSHFVSGSVITDDSSRIVYTATLEQYGFDENIYSIPVAGGTPAMLFEAPGGDESLDRFDVSPDSTRVVYSIRGGSDVNSPDKLMSVPISGPASSAVQLNGTGSRSLELFVQFAPDGSRVLFEGYDDYDGGRSLVSAPIAGPASAAATIVTTPAGEGLGPRALSDDGRYVAWAQGEASFNPHSVFGAPADGSGAAVKLSRTSVDGTLVASDFGGQSVGFTPDGDVLFTGVQDNSDMMELHRVPATGPASAGETVNGPFAGDGDVYGYAVTSDGSIVVYIADQDSNVVELYAAGPLPAAPSDGGGGDDGGGDTTPPDPGDVERWSGADRYDTAAAASARTFAPGVPVAYVAVGANFPDALAGVAAAGVQGGPILLTATSSIPSGTATELSRLQPGRIVVLGGTGAVSASVMAQLGAYTDGTVTRLSGSGRFDTAAAVSAATFDPGVPVAYIATGTNFPDALAGGPAAGSLGGPILLTLPDELPDATANELARVRPQRIVVLGGTGVVSEAVRSQLASFTTGSVTRLSGSGRYETAAAVSAATFGPGVPIVLVAVGTNFPDALAGGPAAVALGGPILLVTADSVPSATATELSRLRPARIVVLGGRGVISDQVAADLDAFITP